MKKEKEYGLVLTGGGTKGAYEFGCYRAMLELGLNITSVVGTSIGAINAALIVQTDIVKMKKIYETIRINNIINVEENIDTSKNIFNIGNMIKLAKDYKRQRGFTNEPLRKMIEENIDVDKIYSSKIGFGMVTYSIKSKEPLEKFKEQIPKSEFIDYLLASSCLPICKPQKIGNIEYYDGGFYDNMPINMLVNKGYKNIIVVDISGIGVKRKLINKNVYVKIIRATEDLGGVMEFNQDKMQKNVTLGYLDTLKAFNHIQRTYILFW
ncbi:MAG: patatin-like phospholipase family protein [Clostridia bacterium]